MSLRQTLLFLILLALVACAVAGGSAVLVRNAETLMAVFLAAICVAIAAGCLLALTFLADRPGFRAGGIAAMGVIVLALLCVLGLIFTEFSRVSGRYHLWEVLAIMLGLTSVYGGLAAVGLLLVGVRWASNAAWLLAAVAAISLSIAAIGAVVEGLHIGRPNFGERLLTMSVFLFGCGFLGSLLLVNAGCGDRRYFRYPAIALAAVAAVGASCAIWMPHSAFMNIWWRTMATGFVIVAVFAHLNLLLMAKPRGIAVWLRFATITLSALCAGIITLAIFTDDTEELVAAALATGIGAFCGTLAIVALALMQRRFDYQQERLATELRDIRITCPRCETTQVLPLGDSFCVHCGIKFSLKAIEPRCAVCGYLLYGVKLRCPECGTPFGSAAGPDQSPSTTGQSPADPPPPPQAGPSQAAPV